MERRKLSPAAKATVEALPFGSNSSYRVRFVPASAFWRMATTSLHSPHHCLFRTLQADFVEHAVERRKLSPAAKVTVEATAFEGNSSYRVRFCVCVWRVKTICLH